MESSKHYQFVEKAIHYLEQRANKHSEPKLADLAQALDTSPFHLQRVFTAWAGISPKQFFHCLQMDHARQLVCDSQSLLNASLSMEMNSPSKLHRLMLQFEAMTPGEMKNKGKGLIFTLGHAESPLGWVYLCMTDKGINSLEFETSRLSYEQWRHEIQMLYPAALLMEDHKEIKRTVQSLFDSTASARLHLRGTSFQIQVWQALIHLPPGHLASYQQIAAAIGKPTASRAVGNAIAKNPVAYLIPCHRVIHTTGELGNYRWETARKKALHIWEFGQLGKPAQ